MKTMTTREFFHSPALAKSLRPGQSLMVTDNWKPNLIVTKAGSRLVKTAEDMRREAADYFEDFQSETWLWSPWRRFEVFNTIRQIARHPDAKRTLTEGDARALTHQLENEVRLGYFLHMEADWRDVMRQTGEISAAHALGQACAATDLLHVAHAAELAADLFVSFDEDQLTLAQTAGLKAVRPE